MKRLLLAALLLPSVALAQPSPGGSTKLWDGAQTADITASSALKVDGSAVTQPVSASSLPLPSGAATESTLSSLNGKVTAVNTGAVVVSSSALPSGAATSAKQPTLGTAGTPSSDVITVQGATSMTALKVDGSGVTQPVSGTFWQATQPVSGTITCNAGSGPFPVSDNAGSLTVDNTGTFAVQAAQSGTWTVQPGNTANTTAWKVDASSVAVPVTDNSGSLTVDAPVGTPAFVRLSDGSAAISTLPVSLASVPSHAVTNAGTFAVQAAQSGTWTVQPGNTANTTPWVVTQTPATSGGLATYHLVSGASTNAASVKASAGQLFCWFVYNSNASARKLAFHNTSGTPTAGASVAWSMMIPGSSAANACSENGIAFSSGIGITTVTGLADSDATGVAANDLVINLFYK